MDAAEIHVHRYYQDVVYRYHGHLGGKTEVEIGEKLKIDMNVLTLHNCLVIWES